MQSDHSDKTELSLLKRLVDKELAKDQKELLNLADRLGYPSPTHRRSSNFSIRSSYEIKNNLVGKNEHPDPETGSFKRNPKPLET